LVTSPLLIPTVLTIDHLAFLGNFASDLRTDRNAIEVRIVVGGMSDGESARNMGFRAAAAAGSLRLWRVTLSRRLRQALFTKVSKTKQGERHSGAENRQHSLPSL